MITSNSKMPCKQVRTPDTSYWVEGTTRIWISAASQAPKRTKDTCTTTIASNRTLHLMHNLLCHLILQVHKYYRTISSLQSSKRTNKCSRCLSHTLDVPHSSPLRSMTIKSRHKMKTTQWSSIGCSNKTSRMRHKALNKDRNQAYQSYLASREIITMTSCVGYSTYPKTALGTNWYTDLSKKTTRETSLRTTRRACQCSLRSRMIQIGKESVSGWVQRQVTSLATWKACKSADLLHPRMESSHELWPKSLQSRRRTGWTTSIWGTPNLTRKTLKKINLKEMIQMDVKIKKSTKIMQIDLQWVARKAQQEH